MNNFMKTYRLGLALREKNAIKALLFTFRTHLAGAALHFTIDVLAPPEARPGLMRVMVLGTKALRDDRKKDCAEDCPDECEPRR